MQVSLQRIHAHLATAGLQPSPSLIAVDCTTQTLVLYCNQMPAAHFAISTAAAGTGNRQDSMRTPCGLHRIREKIGAGAPPERIFRDRVDTGEDCPPDDRGENRILARILRLEGLEEGVNKGEGIDTLERCIYIHATNREDRIGTPFSHGCICMKKHDIIALFDMVKEGTLVHIA